MLDGQKSKNMILTGSEIIRNIRKGQLQIEPFNIENINPNSYTYSICDEMHIINASLEEKGLVYSKEIVSLIDGKWLLKKGCLYLTTTLERIGSKHFVVSLIGRSSIGRFGLFVQISANLGHQGSFHRWTLELRPSIDIYIYPYQPLGQVSFWCVQGTSQPYSGVYGNSDEPLMSNII